MKWSIILFKSSISIKSRNIKELGISQIIVSGMIKQLLAGSKLIDIDKKQKEDKDFFWWSH